MAGMGGGNQGGLTPSTSGSLSGGNQPTTGERSGGMNLQQLLQMFGQGSGGGSPAGGGAIGSPIAGMGGGSMGK